MSVLSLAHVRWRSRRDPIGGPPLVFVSFLHVAGDQQTTATVAGIRGYFASLVGRPRRDYDPTVPDTIAGDRRLGRGLSAVCQAWYRWESPPIAVSAPSHVHQALARGDIETPSALRLRLFDLANERFAGFVPTSRREEALAFLAETLGLSADDAPHLARVLLQDAGEEAVLRAIHPRPAVEEVVAAYNRAALAAVLRQSQRVVFTLHAPEGGLLRRLYALCHYLGVYCDVEQAGLLKDDFRLTLAGPDAVVAPPAVAGQRLATVSLRLLRQLGPLGQASADLLIQGRSYRFPLDRAILDVPGLAADALGPDHADEDEAGSAAGHGAPEPEATFDSEVEARLAREFAALRRQDRAAGWRLVREPAPLLAGQRVLLPDFALVRGETRVFVEVVGFWTESYLTKKRRALEQLPSETPLVLAVGPPGAAVLAGLPFPMVLYRNVIPVTQLLALAEARYGNFSTRTAGAAERLTAACAADAADAAGRIPEETLAPVLGCFSPGEVTRTLAAMQLPSGWMHLPGAGLIGPRLHAAVDTALMERWAAGDTRLGLSELRLLVPDAALPESDETLTALLEQRPGSCRVVRASLFAVDVYPPGFEPAEVGATAAGEGLALTEVAGAVGARGATRVNSANGASSTGSNRRAIRRKRPAASTAMTPSLFQEQEQQQEQGPRE